jgi:hypothetical protein
MCDLGNGVVLVGVVLLPRATHVLDIRPPSDWYPREFSGVFKDETQDATLSLKWADPNASSEVVAPQKDLIFKAQLPLLLSDVLWGYSTGPIPGV